MLKTYLVEFIHKDGNGWAIVNATSPNAIQNMMDSTYRYQGIQIVAIKELKCFGNTEEIVYEGVITTFGKSAYDIAVMNGYEGTVDEWLESMRGPQGEQGETGPQGPQGEKGNDGTKGDKGDKGDDGATGIEAQEVAIGYEVDLKRGSEYISAAYIPYADANENQGGVITAYDKGKIDGIDAALATKADDLSSQLNTDGLELYLKSGNTIIASEQILNAGNGHSGLMTSDDKYKLNGIEDDATCNIIDANLNASSTNAVQNKVVTAAIYDRIEKGLYWDFTRLTYSDAGEELDIDGSVYVGEDEIATMTAYLPVAGTLDEYNNPLPGVMSVSDKTKLDSIEEGANKTLFDNEPTADSTKAVTSGGMFDYYRGAFFDFNYTPTAENWEVSFLDKENNERLSITFDCANTVEGIAGLMSLADKTKLDALPTNADLTTALNGKEDKVAIEAPVNSVDATQPITTLATETGKYYRIDVAVETLAITLPTITDNTKVQNVVLYLKGGTTPAVTFSGGTIYYQSGFAIEAGKTYEVNCLYNGVAWVVAAVEIDEV